ncbi:MAG: hypothetical protein HY554_09375 [Elusimicrobia bacterium]|nr:hypothetical protein [Elusimicrobiota bacterium]
MNPPANQIEPKTPVRPRRRLAGPDLDRYAAAASRLILAGRLNRWYPDPYACSSLLRSLGATFRAGVYDGAWIDLASGMPTLQEVVTVKADRDVAAEFLQAHAARQSAGRAPTPRVAAKVEYYRRLAQLDLQAITSLDVRLRRVDPARKVAAFEAVFDRYDAAENVFARYTFLLEQKDGALGTALIERSGDYSRQTELFRDSMERYAADESELAFLLLGRMDGVRVEEVTRARIGPLWSFAAPSPPGWLPDGPEGSGEFILHLPLDRASVDLEEDRDQDPFATIYRHFLSKDSRPLIEEEARRLGYRVHKERKFACTAAVAPLLKQRLREAQTSNLVYVSQP